MVDSPLKTKLQHYKNKRQKSTAWTIGHRGGGTLQFPEHTLESNLAGARMGAGILECDVAFTKDRQLVCRHSQCDLHTTTNIVTIPELNSKCTKPFTPANGTTPASAKCCTSDLTVAEFLSLCGKMDASNSSATTPEDYLGGTYSWRTDLYSQCATLMTLPEHIQLVERLGLEHSPELKTPEVAMPFQGNYTQEMYAQQFTNTFRDAKVDFSRVYPQSFLYADILYWIKNEPKFAKKALFLHQGNASSLAGMKADGVHYVSPPFQLLLTTSNGTIVPSVYAKEAKRLGLKIVSWSFDRSPPLATVNQVKDSYYSTFASAITRDGDAFVVLDILANEVGVAKMFSDWAATTVYFANAFGLK